MASAIDRRRIGATCRHYIASSATLPMKETAAAQELLSGESDAMAKTVKPDLLYYACDVGKHAAGSMAKGE